jgi:sec-independent protein translocase protein TatC
MADEPGAERLDETEEEEGGPVKSFLEHLEDLRWVLIKIVVGVAVTMLLCLLGANYVLAVLKWPLDRADKFRKHPPHEVVFAVGTNVIATVQPETNVLGQLPLGTNTFSAFELTPILSGSNYVLALRPVTNAAALESISRKPTKLSTFGPVGGFWVAFQVAMYGGIVIAAPYLIYVIGAFVLPALKIKERKYVLRGFGIGTGLFLTGVAFCYFVLMPLALRASYQYSEWLGFSADQWRAEDYISFVCKFMLGMGLGFELPVVILTLVKIGILDYPKLKAMRPYMIVINLILGAVLTTPEVITQVLMFIPLQALYELTIWIAWYWDQEDRAKARRRLAFVILMLLLAAALAWLAYRYGWPWLKRQRD